MTPSTGSTTPVEQEAVQACMIGEVLEVADVADRASRVHASCLVGPHGHSEPPQPSTSLARRTTLRFALGGQHKLAGLTGAAYKFTTAKFFTRATGTEPVVAARHSTRGAATSVVTASLPLSDSLDSRRGRVDAVGCLHSTPTHTGAHGSCVPSSRRP